MATSDGMIRVDYVVVLAHAAPLVFRALTDVSAYPTWQPDVLACRPEEDAPPRVGTVVRETRKLMNRRIESVLIVTGLERDRLLTLETARGSRPWLRQAYRIDPDDAGRCRVKLSIDLDAGSRITESILRRYLTDDARRRFERLDPLLSSDSRPESAA